MYLLNYCPIFGVHCKERDSPFLVVIGMVGIVASFLPQMAEANTPRPVDAVGECSLYDGFMAGIPAWTNRMSELKSGSFVMEI
jgi:hypothetical protein